MYKALRSVSFGVALSIALTVPTLCSAQSRIAVGLSAGMSTALGDSSNSVSPTTTLGVLVFLDAAVARRISIGGEVSWAAPRTVLGRLERLPSRTDFTIGAYETYVSVPVKINAVSASRFDVQAVVAGGIALGHATISGMTENFTAPASRSSFVNNVSTRAPVVTVGLEAGLKVSRRSAFVFAWRLHLVGDRHGGGDDEFLAALGGSASRLCGGVRYLF